MLNKLFVLNDKKLYAQKLSDFNNKIQCYYTGDSNVISVCHHSGRFLSSKADIQPAFYQDYSLEFVDILTDKEAKAAHSKEFAHYLPYSPLKVLVIPGSILLFLGVIWSILFGVQVTSLNVVERVYYVFERLAREDAITLIAPLFFMMWSEALLPVVFTGVGFLMLVVGANQYRIYKKKGMSRPLDAIPLLGELYKVMIKEEVELDMAFSGIKKPQITMTGGMGDIRLDVYATQDQIEELRQAYRKKGEKYGFSPIDDFHLGWLAIKSSPYIKWEQQIQSIMAIKKKISSMDVPKYAKWYSNTSHKYSIIEQSVFSRDGVPEIFRRCLLWVRPVLKELSGGHTLQLEFDVEDDYNHLYDWPRKEAFAEKFWRTLSQAKLRKIEIKVGKNAFQDSSQAPILHSMGRISQNQNIVTWYNISFSTVLTGKSKKKHLIDVNDSVNEYPLSVTFSRPLTHLKDSLQIVFELVADAASLSGVDVDSKRLWYPNGRPIEDQDKLIVQYESVINGKVSIHPSIFAFQKEITSSKVLTPQTGCVLNSRVVAKIIKILEEHNITIKSVDDSIPTVETEVDLPYEKSTWNITSRFYLSAIHPIDVIIVLVNRVPLAEGEVTIWGNITCRALQTHQGNKQRDQMVATNEEKELNEYLKDRCEFVESLIEPLLQPTNGNEFIGTSRVLGQN